MPSWGIHLATANEIANKLNIKNKDEFIIGNFLPDAERYVVSDFSIYVPYDISHFAEIKNFNKEKEKLPNYNKFFIKYKGNFDNPIVLGYYTHLLTDYYWNNLCFSKYSIRDKGGKVIGVKLENGEEVQGDKELRRILKQNDFAVFGRALLNRNEQYIPKFSKNITSDLKVLEETKYNANDILKIIDFLKELAIKSKNTDSKDYKMFTEEKMYEYYLESIKFINNIILNADE